MIEAEVGRPRPRSYWPRSEVGRPRTGGQYTSDYVFGNWREGCRGVPSPGTPPCCTPHHATSARTSRAAAARYPPRHGAGTQCPRTPSSGTWYSSDPRTRLRLVLGPTILTSRQSTKGNPLLLRPRPLRRDESVRRVESTIRSRSTRYWSRSRLRPRPRPGQSQDEVEAEAEAESRLSSGRGRG